jgi:hypothetical protein
MATHRPDELPPPPLARAGPKPRRSLRIAQERPDDPDVHAGWARAGWRLAVMVFDARSVPEGISLLAEPIAIQERLARRYPNRPEYRSDLARSYNNLGIMHRRNNQNDLGGKDWSAPWPCGINSCGSTPTTCSTAVTLGKPG